MRKSFTLEDRLRKLRGKIEFTLSTAILIHEENPSSNIVYGKLYDACDDHCEICVYLTKEDAIKETNDKGKLILNYAQIVAWRAI
jgi:hypothetical protein